MATLVTLSARDIVAQSKRFRAEVQSEYQRELLTKLREKCQAMMGLIAVHGLDVLHRARLQGNLIATAALNLPEEQAIAFLRLAAVPDDFEHWMELRLYFDRVWCDTARFDGDQSGEVAS